MANEVDNIFYIGIVGAMPTTDDGFDGVYTWAFIEDMEDDVERVSFAPFFGGCWFVHNSWGCFRWGKPSGTDLFCETKRARLERPRPSAKLALIELFTNTRLRR